MKYSNNIMNNIFLFIKPKFIISFFFKILKYYF